MHSFIIRIAGVVGRENEDAIDTRRGARPGHVDRGLRRKADASEERESAANLGDRRFHHREMFIRRKRMNLPGARADDDRAEVVLREAAQVFTKAGEIEPEGRQGQPTVLRTINAGFLTHSPHIHGNSIFQLTKQSGDTVTCTDNVLELDTWTLPPMARTDVLLPFERPPDIPLAAWPPKQEPFPLRYVMHCHTEMSQTAGGGNYPQGLVTHWEITAPL